MIITLEEHVTTAEFLKATAKQMPDAAHSAKLEERLLDLGAGRIAAMDAEGVGLQVLSVAATGQEKLDASTATALVREANDDWPLQVGADRLMYSVDYPYRENA